MKNAALLITAFTLVISSANAFACSNAQVERNSATTVKAPKKKAVGQQSVAASSSQRRTR